jgi:hypothetical protein
MTFRPSSVDTLYALQVYDLISIYAFIVSKERAG